MSEGSYQVGICVIHKIPKTQEEQTDVYDISGLRRISPGVYVFKLKDEYVHLPEEAGEKITDEFIEKKLAQHYLYEK